MGVPFSHLRRLPGLPFHKLWRTNPPVVEMPESPQHSPSQHTASLPDICSNHMEETESADKPTDTGAVALGPPIPSCDVELPATLSPRVPLYDIYQYITPLIDHTYRFALIIAIDDYIHCTKLGGAVADAKAIKDHLEEVLRVPEDHIHTLFDEEATRDAIIKAFRDLRDDQRIQPGDPILIFFAGHGSELPPPHLWDVHGQIQCLLPRDYEPTNTHPIPDRTIGALIEDIAKAKGDNITVIFDCCHSASGTRVDNTKYVPRTVILNHSIPHELDHAIWGHRTGKIPEGFSYHGLRSHVLLAACGEKEYAYEHEGRGAFTMALLSTLKEFAVRDLIYIELLERIHLPKQNPRCEGYNRYRTLFNSTVSAGRDVRYPVQLRDSGCVIFAGSAHGVSRGVEFTLYGEQKKKVIVVDDTVTVEDFQSTITSSFHLANGAFAKLTRVGKVPFYLPPQGDIPPSLETLRRMSNSSPQATNFRFVKRVEEAKLEVVVDGQRAVFNILDRRVNEFGLTRLVYSVALNNIAQVLSVAAQYYWYLDMTNKNSRIGIKPRVAVDFYLLETHYDDDGLQFYVPVEPGFCRQDPNSDSSGVVDFVIDPGAVYGFKITNNTSMDLYLNAFLFNNNNLSIESYYTPPSNEGMEAPLKRTGSFTIGYGPGGTTPFEYSLEKDQDVDVGYLKIFFSIRPIDLSEIVQRPQFSTNMLDARNLTDGTARKARVSPQTQESSEPIIDVTWFTVEIPVVQRRKLETAEAL